MQKTNSSMDMMDTMDVDGTLASSPQLPEPLPSRLEDGLVADSDTIGSLWSRFWFRPATALPLSRLRIGVGLMGIYFLISHTADLWDWFGAEGRLPMGTIRGLLDETDRAGQFYGWSYLRLAGSATVLGMMHVAGIVVLAMLSIGCWSRVACVGSLVVVLAYVHRAPPITGHLEPILTMLLAYLCIGRCGDYYSYDAWRRARTATNHPLAEPESTVANHIGIRLIQLHLCAFYLMMGLTKLAGLFWWNGQAVWWILAQQESPLVDLTYLRGAPLLVNAWTHLAVFFEIAFALLVWHRRARPILLCGSFVHWPLLALITGRVSLAAIMLTANLAFASVDRSRRERGAANHIVHTVGCASERC